jgi:cytochrome b561
MPSQKYPFILRLFHWVMALIIIGLIVLGFLMARVLTDEPYTWALFTWHKSFGVLALILIALRLPARYMLRRMIPALPALMPKYERISAKIGHILLYSLMVIAPLSGYLMSSTYPQSSGIALFGLKLPDALPKNDVWASIFTGIHIVSTYCLAAIIVVHLLAVMKHRYFDAHDRDILKKMW